MAGTPEDLTGKFCSVEGVSGNPNSVIGKWRLISEIYPFVSTEKFNYPCYNVVYEFKKDGVCQLRRCKPNLLLKSEPTT